MRGRRYTAPPLTSTCSVVCQSYKEDNNRRKEAKKTKVAEEPRFHNRIGVFRRKTGYKYAALPEAWKKYCFGTDEVALFPLILIDDKVCWYGYPCADNAFQDNDWSFKTMLPVTLRITGSKTIEILKMLANLEYRKVKEFRVPLIPKGNEQDPNHNVNLSEYIAKTMKCPTCGHNLMLASPHGKPFIKCSSSSCKYTQLLTVDIVNGYLDRSNARCPVNGCNAELQARLGPYGVYVLCDNGHKSSPTKI